MVQERYCVSELDSLDKEKKCIPVSLCIDSGIRIRQRDSDWFVTGMGWNHAEEWIAWPGFIVYQRIDGYHINNGYHWLVVWLPFFIFQLILGLFHHPNWRTPSFFRGVGIQPPTRSYLRDRFLCEVSSKAIERSLQVRWTPRDFTVGWDGKDVVMLASCECWMSLCLMITNGKGWLYTLYTIILSYQLHTVSVISNWPPRLCRTLRSHKACGLRMSAVLSSRFSLYSIHWISDLHLEMKRDVMSWDPARVRGTSAKVLMMKMMVMSNHDSSLPWGLTWSDSKISEAHKAVVDPEVGRKLSMKFLVFFFSDLDEFVWRCWGMDNKPKSDGWLWLIMVFQNCHTMWVNSKYLRTRCQAMFKESHTQPEVRRFADVHRGWHRVTHSVIRGSIPSRHFHWRTWSFRGIGFLVAPWRERPFYTMLLLYQIYGNYKHTYSGWWFGCHFLFLHIFAYIGNNHSNWLIFFRKVETTNQY